jgi:hypothetical protein
VHSHMSALHYVEMERLEGCVREKLAQVIRATRYGKRAEVQHIVNRCLDFTIELMEECERRAKCVINITYGQRCLVDKCQRIEAAVARAKTVYIDYQSTP